MAKAARFPRKLEVWVPDAIAEGFELLASDGLLTISDHARQAFRLYLTQLGALKARPMQSVNGQQQEQARGVHL
jgi:hypothetical protein